MNTEKCEHEFSEFDRMTEVCRKCGMDEHGIFMIKATENYDRICNIVVKLRSRLDWVRSGLEHINSDADIDQARHLISGIDEELKLLAPWEI